jgi:hypothetical protein
LTLENVNAHISEGTVDDGDSEVSDVMVGTSDSEAAFGYNDVVNRLTGADGAETSWAGQPGLRGMDTGGAKIG